MLRLFLTLLLLTGNAYALPVDLSTALYNTSAYAEIGADSDGIHADSSPPTDLPLFSHAGLVGNDDTVTEFANADAIADNGFLAVSSEAQGSLNRAGAVAEAALEQTLSIAGSYLLELDFESLLDLLGGEAGASLGLVVSAGSRTVFDELFTSSAEIARRFELAPGEIGLLYIGLTSSADAFGDGASGQLYAFNLASVEVALHAVPSPSSLVLIAAGLIPLALRRRARKV